MRLREKNVEYKHALLNARYNMLQELQKKATEHTTFIQDHSRPENGQQYRVLEHVYDYKQVAEESQAEQREESIHSFGPKLTISQFSGADSKPKSLDVNIGGMET